MSKCRKRRKLRRHRRPHLQHLEQRLQLAADHPYQNPGQAFDVSRDLRVSALDALQVINFIGQHGIGYQLPGENTGRNFPDVNGSDDVTALDALLVINQLGRGSKSLSGRLVHDSAPGQRQNLDFTTNQYDIEFAVSAGDGSEQLEIRVNGVGNDPFTLVGDLTGTDPYLVTETQVNAIGGQSMDDGDHRIEFRLAGDSGGQEFVITLDTLPPNLDIDSLGGGAAVVSAAASQDTAPSFLVVNSSHSSWQNTITPSDVSADGIIDANDALLVLQELQRRSISGSQILPTEPPHDRVAYYDVNGDRRLSAHDVLLVVNAIQRNQHNGDPGATHALAEGISTADTLGDSPFTISGRVSDAVSGVKRLTARFEAGQPEIVEPDGSGFFTYTAPLPNDAASGEYHVELSAVDVAGNAVIREVSFEFTRDSSIQGVVFLDSDGDGQRSIDESGLDGWQVLIFDDAGNLVDSATTSDIDFDGDGVIEPLSERGAYWFRGLVSASYQVTVTAPFAWDQTFPGDHGHDIDLLDGQQIVDVDFGFQENVVPILLVDDDGGEDAEETYASILDAIRPEQYELWDVARFGSPSAEQLQAYNVVIWETGSKRLPAVSLDDKQDLKVFLDGGGSLLLSSRSLLDGNFQVEVDFLTGGRRVDSFVEDTLGIQPPYDPPNPTELAGVSADPTWSDLSLTLNNASLSINDQQHLYLVLPNAPTTGVIEEATGRFPGFYAGLTRDTGGPSAHRLAFWSFDISDIDVAASATADADRELLDRTLNWLSDRPLVHWSRPVDGEVDFPTNGALDIAFRVPIDTSAIASNLALRDSIGTRVAFSWEYQSEGRSLRVTPDALAPSTSYQLELQTGLADRYGNQLETPWVLAFQTATGDDLTAPSTPDPPRVVAAGTGNGQISLETDEPPLGEAYHLYRRLSGQSDWNRLNRAPLRGSAFVDADAVDEVFYEYAVSSEDAARNESGLSAAVTALSWDSIPPGLAITEPILFGNRYRTQTSTIQLRGQVTDLDADVTVAGLPASVNGLGWQGPEVDLPHEGPNLIHVSATDAAGNRTIETVFVARDTTANAPRQIQVIAQSSTINLITGLIPSDVDIVQHEVERREANPDSEFALRATLNALEESFEDQLEVESESYCYRARAVDDLGNISEYTEEVCPVGFGGGVAGIRGGSRTSDGRFESDVRPNNLTDPVPIQDENGSLRVRYFDQNSNAEELIGPGISGWQSTVHLHDILIENPAGFGDTLTVSITPPVGYRFNVDQTHPFSSLPLGPRPNALLSAYGIYIDPPDGHVRSTPPLWDESQTLEGMFLDRTVEGSVSQELLTFTIKVEQSTDPDDRIEGDIKAVRLGGFGRYAGFFDLRRDHPSAVELAAPRISVDINGVGLEAALPVPSSCPARENSYRFSRLN